MPEPIEVRKVPLHNVSDAGELAKLFDAGVLAADRVVAINIKWLSIGKRHRDAHLRQVSRKEPVQGRLMIAEAVS